MQQPSPRHTRRLGNIAIQIITLAVIGSLAYAAVFEAVQNLARAHIASGFGFWKNTAGFDISQALIAYSPSASTFGRAFWVGLLNTLIVAAIGIVLATALGFAVGWPGWYPYPGIWFAGPYLSFGMGYGIGFFGGFGWGWPRWGFNWGGRFASFGGGRVLFPEHHVL